MCGKSSCPLNAGSFLSISPRNGGGSGAVALVGSFNLPQVTTVAMPEKLKLYGSRK